MHEVVPFLLMATFQTNKGLQAETAYTVFLVQETYASYLDLCKLCNVFLLGKGACTRALANHAIPATS